MSKPLVEAVSASQSKVGTVVRWPTPGGMNHGVVVGTESTDLLVLTVYGKGSKSDPMVKKYRDEALTAKLTSPNPKLVMDIQRVPAAKATAQDRLTGPALRPYTQASVSLGEARGYGPLATLLQRLGEALQTESNELKIITSILDDADEPKYSAKDVAMKGVATLKAIARSEKDPKTRKATKGASVEVTDETGYDDASGKLLSDKIFRLFGKDHVLVDFGRGDRDLVRTDYVVLEGRSTIAPTLNATLTPTQKLVLAAVIHHSYASRIAKATRLTPSAVSVALRELRDLGLVRSTYRDRFGVPYRNVQYDAEIQALLASPTDPKENWEFSRAESPKLEAADAILTILKDRDSAHLTDLAQDARLRGVHFAKIRSAANALVEAKKILSKNDVLTLA